MQNALVVLTLSALVAGASLSLSDACTSGLTAVQKDAAANSCTAISGLLNILVTPDGQSLITPVNNWLTSFCGASDCSSDTISSVVQSVSQACQTDLANLGVTADDIAQALPYIQQNFGAAKEIICLADTSKDEFCATEMASDLEAFLGQPLTISSLQSDANLQTAESVPTNITCVPCTQAALVKLKATQLNDLVDLSAGVATECGSDFAAVSTSPSNIIVGTGTNVPKGSPTADGASTLAAGSIAALAGVVLAALLA